MVRDANLIIWFFSRSYEFFGSYKIFSILFFALIMPVFEIGSILALGALINFYVSGTDLTGFIEHLPDFIGSASSGTAAVPVVFASLFLGFSSISVIVGYWQTRLAAEVGVGYGYHLFSMVNKLSLDEFASLQKSGLMATIILECNRLGQQVIMPGISAFSAAISIVIISYMILSQLESMRLDIVVVVAIFYMVSVFITKRYFSAGNYMLAESNRSRVDLVQQLIDGFCSIRLFGRNEVLVRRYSQATGRISQSLAKLHVVGIAPRYLLEIFLVAGLVITMSMGEFSIGNLLEVPEFNIIVVAWRRCLHK